VSATERAAIEAAKMTEEDLVAALWSVYCGLDAAELREGIKENGDDVMAWREVARRARELLATPTLPPEPLPGFVRARFPIAVGEDGQWCVSAASHDQESVSIEATDWFRREGYPSRVSFVTVDVPLPSPPAEITGTVTP